MKASSFCILGGAALAFLMPVSAQEKVTYQDNVLPIIENNCGKCHNPDKKKGDLDLTSYGGAMKGGGSGPAVVAGNPESSKLWKAITHAEDPEMPPNKPKLPDKELEVFRKWIAGGLLETTGSKAVVPSKPRLDLTLKPSELLKPEGPPPMPTNYPAGPLHPWIHGNPIVGLAGSPWSPLLAVSGQKQVLLYNTETLDRLGALDFEDGQPDTLRFSRNGKVLMAGGGRGGRSGRVVLWSVESGQKLATAGKEYDAVLAADLSPDQSRIALGGPDRLVKIYSVKDGELLHKIKKHTDWVQALSFSPNGEMLFSGDRNGGLSVWDPENAQELFALNGHKSAITQVDCRSDSKLAASASEDGTIKLWELQEGKPFKSWNAHNGGVLSVQFLRDGRLISCGRDNAVTLWDANGNKVRSFEFNGELPIRVTASPDGDRIFATDWRGHILVWNSNAPKSTGEISLATTLR